MNTDVITSPTDPRLNPYRTAFPHNPLAKWVEDRVNEINGVEVMTPEKIMTRLVVRIEALEKEVAALTTVINGLAKIEEERVKRVLAGVEGA